MIKKETFTEEAREVLKELDVPVDKQLNSNIETESSLIQEKEPVSIEKHSKKLQKTLFSPTELRRSKSMDNCQIKDDVLWQLGKTSEDLAKNFSSFCKIYSDKQDQVSFLNLK